jgi:hypothetical protein
MMLAGAVDAGLVVQGMVTALALGLIGGSTRRGRRPTCSRWRRCAMKAAAPPRVKGVLARIGNQSFRNLWRRRNRTLLSAAGIGIGVGTLVMLGGLVDGLMGQLNSLAGSGGAGNITVMQREVADMSLSSLDERIVRQIGAMPEVKTVSPFTCLPSSRRRRCRCS